MIAGPGIQPADAGLVPMSHETGRHIRGRPSIGHGGNARLRTVLSPATLIATQRNPVNRAFYNRLRVAGTPLKVALCAAGMRRAAIAPRPPPPPRRHRRLASGHDDSFSP